MRRLLIVLAQLALVSAPTFAATWHVNPAGTGDFPDIQSAVAGAANGDEILLADGVFTGPGNRRVSFLGKAITIGSASGNADACTIDFAGNYEWAFEFNGGEGPSSVVSDITLLGYEPLNPYNTHVGVRMTWAAPTLRGVVFRCNFAVSSAGGSPRIETCVLEDGCGMAFSSGASPVVTGCAWEAGSLVSSRGRIRVTGSTIRIEDCAGEEGEILLSDSSGEILGCDLRDSRVNVLGDGVDVLLEDCRFTDGWQIRQEGAGASFVVRNCTIQGNAEEGIRTLGDSQVTIEGCVIQGNVGAGVLTYGSQASLRHCLITGNRDGGVRSWRGGSPTVAVVIEDCTIASNGRSLAWGGGLYVRDGVDASVRRSTLWGNCAGEGQGPAAWVKGTLELECANVDTTAITGGGLVQIVGGLLEENPLFCEPIDCGLAPHIQGDFALQADSPALGQACGVIGGQGEGCAPIAVESVSWGTVKAGYR